MAPLLVLALLAAQPTPPLVLMPDLQSVNLEPARAQAYTARLAQRLVLLGVRVRTSGELAAVIGLDRQRQLLGCSDDTCRGLALEHVDAEGLLVGTASKLGSKWALDVSILAPGSGARLASASATGTDEDTLLSSLPLVAQRLAEQLSTALGRPLVATGTEEHRPALVKRLAWVPLALGVAAGVGGGVGLGLAQGTAAELKAVREPGAALTLDKTAELVAAGKLQQTLGWVGVGVGAAGLVGAAAMFLFGGEEVVSASLAVTPGAAAVTFTGRF